MLEAPTEHHIITNSYVPQFEAPEERYIYSKWYTTQNQSSRGAIDFF
jgi:hypothetical protein